VGYGAIGMPLIQKTAASATAPIPWRLQPPCPNIRISWRKLSVVVWDIFAQSLTNVDALELCVKDKWSDWTVQKTKIEGQVKDFEGQISRLEQKRRQYSWQQPEGIISDEELLRKLKEANEAYTLSNQMQALRIENKELKCQIKTLESKNKKDKTNNG
jgi:hypothetical protein